jgi:hypothetical protein
MFSLKVQSKFSLSLSSEFAGTSNEGELIT